MEILKNVKHLFESDEESLEFLRILENQFDQEIPLLRGFFEGNDLVHLKKVTHKLKATFKNLDLEPIREAIILLDETNDGRHDREDLREYYIQFNTAFSILEHHLDENIRSYTTGSNIS